MIGKKEILWEKIDLPLYQDMMRQVYANTHVFISGISFGCCSLKINVQYDNSEFKELLEEKFDLAEPYQNVPCLTFVKHKKSFGFKLPYEQYGYVSDNKRSALVFASSFGVFKSVISGYASLCLEHCGYIPVHGSVFSVEQRGIILTGGTLAGKTTTLLQLIEIVAKDNRNFKILTDDWAIMKEKADGYIAQTFDHSVSLRERDIVENPNIYFNRHDELVGEICKRSKISIKPERLYGMSVGADQIRIDVVILLKSQSGSAKLKQIDEDKFANEVIDAAYHYPYITQCQIEKHKDFWMVVARRLKVFEFSTRPMIGKLQCIDEIRRLLI